MTEEPTSAQAAEALARAQTFTDHLQQQLGPNASSGVTALVLLTEFQDARDYGDHMYADLLLGYACQIASNYRAHIMRAQQN